MSERVKVGVIGDYNPNLWFHVATNEALGHGASALSVSIDLSWIPTPSLAKGFIEPTLKPFDALWCSPGSPYKSMNGALRAIQFAREQGWPFVGT